MAKRVLNVFLQEALVGQLEQDDSGTCLMKSMAATT